MYEPEINYRNATIEDLDFLVESRLDFIHISVNNTNYEFMKNNIHKYFQNAINEESCDIVFAQSGASIIGKGIIFYYNSVLSLFNPCGKNAYITSMYVNEKFRRRGIATTILDKLINTAKLKNYNIFLLQASDMGKPLYIKYGFNDGKKGMILKINEE